MNLSRTVDAIAILDEEDRKDPEMAARVQIELKKLLLSIKLREIREKARLTQKQLAERIGSSQSAIARMESGDYNRMSMTLLQKYALALGFVMEIDFKEIDTTQAA
ncbi:MAG: helix-turn-helix transcriptional regulator [Candidatus Hatepunaea meridiana]|nr:helix-turn-helix transcriptional regulator [Candidatus Hatepunaea meridiana]